MFAATATASRIATKPGGATNLTPEFVLGMLSNIQDNLGEYQAKVLEMEEELRTLKIENNLLRSHIRELMTPPEQKK
jgi:hypothetical protein